jgi:hypothetical protein
LTSRSNRPDKPHSYPFFGKLSTAFEKFSDERPASHPEAPPLRIRPHSSHARSSRNAASPIPPAKGNTPPAVFKTAGVRNTNGLNPSGHFSITRQPGPDRRKGVRIVSFPGSSAIRIFLPAPGNPEIPDGPVPRPDAAAGFRENRDGPPGRPRPNTTKPKERIPWPPFSPSGG